MAERQQTPTELGIPLPLVPVDNLAHAGGPLNWHHHFHPRKDPLLETEGGSVIRTARLQRAYTYGNHQEYHDHFSGPPLPATDQERFRVAVLARAGFIPQRGILLRGDKSPMEVILTNRQRNLLKSEGQIRSGSPGMTRTFLAGFVLAQDMSDIKESVIDELMHTHNQERKRLLGNFLLAEALQRTVEPVASDYRQAWSERKIPHNQPARPHRFLRLIIGSKPTEREKFMRKFEQKLAA